MLAQFRLLVLPKHKWSTLNELLKDRIAPLRTKIFTQDPSIPLSNSCAALWTFTEKFLLEDVEVRSQVYAPAPHKYRQKKPAALVRLGEQKKRLEKDRFKSPDDHENFMRAVRAHSNLNQKFKDREHKKSLSANEAKFKRDKFTFSKELLRENSERAEPAFDKTAAENFLALNYGAPKNVDVNKLEKWIQPLPDETFVKPFNAEPIRPRDIRAFLKKRKSNSAPGPDRMTYAILKNLPCLHHPLATIYNRMREQDAPCAQEGWEVSKSILIYKRGPKATMENFRRIGLSNVMGKVYHALLSRDLTDYLTSNNIIDKTLQKAFIPGVDGCREHTLVNAELVKDARKKNHSLYLTSLDLRDAFGSTSHELMLFLLRWARVPEPLCRYVADFLQRLRTRVHTKQWTTDAVPIRVGTMQGDTLSPILFLLVINPIIMYLRDTELKHGYILRTGADDPGTRYITTPFADDFNLLTRHPATHQRILKSIHQKITDLCLTLKVSKCVSLGIKSGAFTPRKFVIDGDTIPTADMKDLVILGMFIPAHGGLKEIGERILSNVSSKLEKIEKCLVRAEIKAEIFSNFYVPALQYLLTVHNLGASHHNRPAGRGTSPIEKIDALELRYLRKWLKIPKSATRSVFTSAVFNFEPISKLAERARVASHVRMREKADPLVLAVLDAKIARESELQYESVKHSVRAEEYYQQARTDFPELKGKQLVDASKNIVNSEHEKAVLDYLAGKEVQGKFADIIELQRQDPFYRSVMYDLPYGQLSWLMRACVDVLPSYRNLRRWGKVLSDKCALCNQPETMRHALSNCKTALDQGRLTFRHNSILLHIVKQMRASKKHSGKRIIADLPGFCLPDGGTIPPELVVTNQKPDIVLIEEKTNAIELFELTSCADSKENIKNAQARKKVRYEVLKSELNAKLQCFEVCALGNIPSHARETIRYLVGKKAARETFKSLAKIAISASYYIFNRRRDTEWHSPSYFERPVVNYGAKE